MVTDLRKALFKSGGRKDVAQPNFGGKKLRLELLEVKVLQSRKSEKTSQAEVEYIRPHCMVTKRKSIPRQSSFYSYTVGAFL